MTQQLLNIPQISPMLQQMRCKTVPKGVHTDRFQNTRLSHCPFENILNNSGAVFTAMLPFKKILDRSVLPVIFTKQFQYFGRKQRITILASLPATDMYTVSFGIDIGYLQIYRFTDAKTAGIDHIQDSPMFEITYLCKNRNNFILGKYCREFFIVFFALGYRV